MGRGNGSKRSSGSSKRKKKNKNNKNKQNNEKVPPSTVAPTAETTDAETTDTTLNASSSATTTTTTTPTPSEAPSSSTSPPQVHNSSNNAVTSSVVDSDDSSSLSLSQSLDSLPPHLLFRIVSGLTEDEQDQLFRVVSNLRDNVEIIREDEEDDEEEEDYNGQEQVTNDDDTTNDSGRHHHHDATAHNSNQDNASSPSPPMRVPMEFVIADSDTLLDRLNTRRLHQRLVHGDEYTYPYNKTTSEIAEFEWQNILIRATRQQQQQQQRQQRRQQRKQQQDRRRCRNNDKTSTTSATGSGTSPPQQPTLPPLIPPSRELLMFTPCPRSVAVLASYPRSGNSLLRSLYEKITLRVSGSDMRGGLVSHDLVGEAAISSNKVQFCKTHYPERRGVAEFTASRVVLLVRNPYDAMESYFNLMTTGTHTASLDEDQRVKLEEVWTNMVQREVHVWQAFHEFWLAQDVPLLLVRYEDLIRFPYQVMCRVIKFVLEINNMDFFASRIERCVADETIDRLGSYRPRSGGIGKSLSKYSPELLQQINMGIFDTMEQLDYTSLLIPNKDEWQELEPLPDYAREYFNNPDNTVLINDESRQLVRTPRHRINWAKLKREMNGMMPLTRETCLCPKCSGHGR